MKRSIRFTGILLVLVILSALYIPVTAGAAGEYIDTSTAAQGYFSVYSSNVGAKMKVGVQYGGSTVYSDYTPGTEASYSFDKGDGSYTLILFENVFATSYKRVAETSVQVTLEDANSKYLVSTNDITFSDDDPVGIMADAICYGIESEEQKVVAIYNYIAANFTYDKAFAQQVKNGEVTCYTPDTSEVLASKSGICCDLSALFAAMCRSQGIACDVVRGYIKYGYHAWNTVCVDGQWYTVDTTYAVCASADTSYSIEDCLSPLQYYPNAV